MQQSTMYNVLTSMNFFKNYLIGKVFRLWRGNVRYRVYNRTRKDLSKALIYTRPDYMPCFMDVNQLLYEMQARQTFHIKKSPSHVDIDEFTTEQRAHHEDVKAFYKGTDSCLLSANGDMWQVLFKALETKELNLTLSGLRHMVMSVPFWKVKSLFFS